RRPQRLSLRGPLITGKQIRDGSIQVKDLSKAARSALKGKSGPRGATGATGLTGATGAQGPKGDPGTSIFGASIPSGTTVVGVWAGCSPPPAIQRCSRRASASQSPHRPD